MIKSHSAWGLVLACGKTEQIAPEVDTAFLQLINQPVLTYSLLAFEQCPDIEGVVVVVPKDRLDNVVGMSRMYGIPKLKKIVGGAIQRTTSLKAGLGALEKEGATVVVVHEASRPCISPATISEVVKGAKRYGTAVAAEKLDVPVAIVPKGLKATKSISGNTVWALQTPVAVKRDRLEILLGLNKDRKTGAVDEAGFMEALYKGAYLVQSERINFRLSSPADIQIVTAALR